MTGKKYGCRGTLNEHLTKNKEKKKKALLRKISGIQT